MKYLLPILIILALLIGKIIGGALAEVVCHNPSLEETDYAVVTATCENGVKVHLVD